MEETVTQFLKPVGQHGVAGIAGIEFEFDQLRCLLQRINHLLRRAPELGIQGFVRGLLRPILRDAAHNGHALFDMKDGLGFR